MQFLTCRSWVCLMLVNLSISVAQADNPAPATVKLTGVTTLFKDKRALLLVQPAVRPGQPPQPEQSCILSEGQSQGGIEVVVIDEKAGHVLIRNNGKEMELTLSRDGLSLPAAAPPATPQPASAAAAAYTPPARTDIAASPSGLLPAPSAILTAPAPQRIVIGRNPRRENPPYVGGGLIAPNTPAMKPLPPAPFRGAGPSSADPTPITSLPSRPAQDLSVDPIQFAPLPSQESPPPGLKTASPVPFLSPPPAVPTLGAPPERFGSWSGDSFSGARPPGRYPALPPGLLPPRPAPSP